MANQDHLDHPVHDHEHDVQAVIEDILKAMSSKGWRITDQRRTLARLFAETDGYLAPKDVYEHLRINYPGVSFDTVYRNLRLLNEMGVLEQFYLNDVLKFRARCRTHHHHHLICMNCEKTITVEYCPMKHMGQLPNHFQVMDHRFEIFGYCSDCASQHHTEQSN